MDELKTMGVDNPKLLAGYGSGGTFCTSFILAYLGAVGVVGRNDKTGKVDAAADHRRDGLSKERNHKRT